jgi:hypothetical protein
MRFKHCNLLVAGHGFTIIDQHPHPHTAIGCMQHSTGKLPAGFITAENEILKIQRSFRGIDHLHSGQKPVSAYRNDAKSGVTVMFARRIYKLSAKPGLLRMGPCRGSSFRIIRTRWKRRASTEYRDDQHDKQKVEPTDHYRAPARTFHSSSLDTFRNALQDRFNSRIVKTRIRTPLDAVLDYISRFCASTDTARLAGLGASNGSQYPVKALNKAWIPCAII